MLKTSIRYKLIALLLVATILPFGTSLVITYFYTKESLKNQAVQENSNLLFQGRVNLTNYIEEINGLTLSLYSNPEFFNFMRSPNKDNNPLAIGIVKHILHTILYAEENINRVEISFEEDNRIISASKRSTITFLEKPTNYHIEEFNRAKANPFNMYIEPNKQGLRQSGTLFTLHRAFRNIPSQEVIAYISLEMRPERIHELSENIYNDEKEEFYILTAEGEVIFSSSKDVSTDNNLWISKLINSEKENGTFEWREASFHGVMIYDKLPLSAGGWYLVKGVPYSSLYESVFNITKINIIFGLIGLLFVVLSTLFISVKITSPIRILLENINQVEKGNMRIQVETFGDDEIGVLGSRFQQMIEKINDLINREYKLALENKTNQLKVLQSQINPHFLYNALQSIGTVALKNNVPQIYSLVTHLSKIMRYGMNMEEDMVALIKEVNYTNAFLLLQKERFGDNLEYTIDIEENLLDIQVPKMIIQPIIENYFKHGFELRDRVGKIDVHCRREDTTLVIDIRDNGIGVTETRLDEIYQHIMDESKIKRNNEENIGLKNVYSRLRLYYNDKASLALRNHEQGGFIVTIKLPISLEGGKNESNHY